MAIQKHSFDASGNAIYGETDNINYFLKTDLVPDTDGGIVNKQSEVKAFSRRRYKGDDEKANIKQTTRDFLYDPGRRNGNATPGDPFILDDGEEKRSFTFTGPFLDLHSFISGDASMDLTLYSPSASYVITATGTRAR